MTSRWAVHTVSGLLCLATALTAAAAEPAQPASSPATSPASQPARVVQFQPNVRIDYARRQVEIDGEVVLRQGLLELFACSPGTREYESIVRLDTTPTVVFQALGLLGLEPGHPLRMDPATAEIIPADGDSVEIDVQYESKGARKTVPIESWMQRSDTKGPLERQTWVFAGSFPARDNRLAADEEGTIIAVVDFESAVVALPRLHTASNAELWLEPRTSAIPDLKTPCTVIFRPGPLRLRMDETGRLYLNGKAAMLGEAARRMQVFARENPDRIVEVEVSPAAPQQQRLRLEMLLAGLRVKQQRRAASRPADTAPAGQPSANDDPDAVPRWLIGGLGTPADNASPAGSAVPSPAPAAPRDQQGPAKQ